MRVLLLALMIALLPLRGWVGDVMAMEMASGHSYAMQNIATPAYSAGAGASFSINSGRSHSECHDAVAAPDASLNTSELADHGDCSDCLDCQICHTTAVPSAMGRDVHVTRSPLLQPRGGIQFASATPAPRLKPPIS